MSKNPDTMGSINEKARLLDLVHKAIQQAEEAGVDDPLAKVLEAIKAMGKLEELKAGAGVGSQVPGKKRRSPRPN